MKLKVKYQSIKFIINFSFIFVYTLSLIITSGYIIVQIHKNAENYKNMLITKDLSIITNYSSELFKNYYQTGILEDKLINELSQNIKNMFKNDNYIHHIIFYNSSTSEILRFANFSGSKIKPPVLKPDVIRNMSVYGKIITHRGLTIKTVNVKHRLADKTVLSGYMQMGFSNKYFNKIVLSSVFFTILLAVILIIISLFAISYAVNYVVNPIQKLIGAADKISKGETTPEIISIKVNNEVGVLVDAFNLMTQNLQERIKDLQTIQILGMEISSELNKKDLLQNIIKIYTTNAKCGKCALLLASDDKHSLELASGYNLNTVKYNIKFGEGAAGAAAVSCNYKIVENITEYPEYLLFYKPDELTQIENKQMLALPLVVKDKLTGVICLAGKEGDSKYSSSEIILYQTLASSAAIAIENSNLYELAITDGLTKIYIHRYFQQKLAEEIEYHKNNNGKLCLIMLDIDHFKTFNDQYGHQQGDIVLQHLAKILHNSTRIIDFRLSDRRSDIVARYGGEEFAVILPLTDIKGAKAVAERIRANVQEYEFPGQDKPLRVTVSLGLAEYKQGLTQVQLIKNADVALYQSKENGRNRISEFI